MTQGSTVQGLLSFYSTSTAETKELVYVQLISTRYISTVVRNKVKDSFLQCIDLYIRLRRNKVGVAENKKRSNQFKCDNNV